MARHKWHEFELGEKYLKEQVVSACLKRISEGGVLKTETKSELVQQIDKQPQPTIVWTPFQPQGWGASPFNPNCWRTPEGDPIIPQDRVA